MSWHASNRNRDAGTLADEPTLPDWYVIADSGIVLERDDGEVRRFRTRETAERAAARLDKGLKP